MRTLLLAFSLIAFAAVPSASAQSVAGEWNASMNTPGGTREFRIVFQVHGDTLAGTVKRATGDVPLSGTIKGNAVNFSYTIEYGGNPLVLTVTATLDGDTMKGTIDLDGGATEAFSARRATAAAPPPRHVDVQAISLLGDTLRALPLSPAIRARYEQQLAEARRAYEHTPANLDSIIWYGRRLGYLGQLRESIEVYSRGLTIHLDNPWLLRHRGHRFVSVRDFDAAVRDLERATTVVEGTPDMVEPDGQPNASGIPIGTLHSNIGYHLALAHYLKGDWAKAAVVAQRELDSAGNDDRRVSMAHWLYMSLRRSGRDAEATRVLAPMRHDMNVVENGAYHRLMLLYKGELPADSVLTIGADGEMSVTDASSAYGVANWHFYNGRRAEAVRLWQRIVAGGQWGAFGTIAAEAELARMRGSVPR